MRIVEHFLSLQGEGLMIGRLTYFVRAAGCSLRCSWCDTAWSRNPDQGEEMSVEDIVALVGDVKNVCFTGGEPLEQKEAPEFLRRLVELGKTVVLETNGATDISVVPESEHIIISMDVKCPSSGMDKTFLMSNMGYMNAKDQLKFVIADRRDLDYAEAFLEAHPTEANVIFSAVGGLDIRTLADEVVSKKLDVRVMPQLHKLIWGNIPGV